VSSNGRKSKARKVFMNRVFSPILILMISFFGSLAAQARPCDLEFKKAKLCAEIQWAIKPKNVEMITKEDRAEFILAFFKKNQPEVFVSPKGSISVQLFMPSMGHGSEPTRVEPDKNLKGEIQEGRFKVTDLYFTMEGDWDIRIELKTGKKKWDEAKFSYHL
jgi:hypothetical protein